MSPNKKINLWTRLNSSMLLPQRQHISYPYHSDSQTSYYPIIEISVWVFQGSSEGVFPPCWFGHRVLPVGVEWSGLGRGRKHVLSGHLSVCLSAWEGEGGEGGKKVERRLNPAPAFQSKTPRPFPAAGGGAKAMMVLLEMEDATEGGKESRTTGPPPLPSPPTKL